MSVANSPAPGSTAKPTARQKKLFRSWQIPRPTSRAACGTVLDFILNGTGSNLPDVGSRVRQVRSWHKMVKAAVKIPARSGLSPSTGRVISLRVRPRAEIKDLMEAANRSGAVYPYVAVVQPSGSNRRYFMPLSALKVVSRAAQKLMFDLF